MQENTEPHSNDASENLKLPPLTQQERKANSREKAKAQELGVSHVSLVEEAKIELAKSDNADLKKILDQEKYSLHLSKIQIEQLKAFIYNRKRKLIEATSKEALKQQLELTMKEKSMRFVNEQTTEIERSLLATMDESTRTALVLRYILDNQFIFI